MLIFAMTRILMKFACLKFTIEYAEVILVAAVIFLVICSSKFET